MRATALLHAARRAACVLLFAAGVASSALAPALASQATWQTPSAPLPMTGLASFLNAAFQAIGTCSSGPTAPAVGPAGAPIAYMCWWNTSTTPAVLEVYDGAQWVTSPWQLNTTTHAFATYRTQLTGPTTYYWRTDGNNNCNGSVNAAGSSGNCAFADPQGCQNYLAQNVDFANQNVTCLAGQTVPETFTPGVSGYQCPSTGFTGGGTITIAGNLNQATVTTPIASPGVVNWSLHGLTAGSPIYLTVTGGSLPTGLNTTQLFYVLSTGLTTNSFEVATSPGGTAINFTGTSSGTQTGNALTTKIDGTVNSGSGIAIANPSCYVNVQNLQIKATVNSLNCIAHNGFSGFNWSNIIWLGSVSIDIFAGTGCNLLQTGTDWIAGQGSSNPHIETDGSSEVRNSGQVTNISANLSYGSGVTSFVYASFHGRITYTKSPTINLNGFTVTGQRCYADSDGLIEQVGLGGTFFPGNAVCGAGPSGNVVQ